MPTWTLLADRRRADLEELRAQLRLLENTVDGLHVDLVDRCVTDKTNDAGKLRDFAPVAHLSHCDLRALEIATDEILLDFGWTVDLCDVDDAP